MKKRLSVSIPLRHPATGIGCGLLALSAVLRLCYYLPKSPSGWTLWVHLLLPLTAAAVFLCGFCLKRPKQGAIGAVVLGVTFFILKATEFTPVHQALCTVLYVAVLVLFTATVLGLLPTKKLLYPLFGLPLLYHIFVEDTQLYFFASPPVPVWDWVPEISVLCIMAGLLSLSIGMEAKRI